MLGGWFRGPEPPTVPVLMRVRKWVRKHSNCTFEVGLSALAWGERDVAAQAALPRANYPAFSCLPHVGPSGSRTKTPAEFVCFHPNYFISLIWFPLIHIFILPPILKKN